MPILPTDYIIISTGECSTHGNVQAKFTESQVRQTCPQRCNRCRQNGVIVTRCGQRLLLVTTELKSAIPPLLLLLLLTLSFICQLFPTRCSRLHAFAATCLKRCSVHWLRSFAKPRFFSAPAESN